MKREPSAPPELPGFTFERLLGSGGFADVFLYQQELPRRLVAVKVLVLENLTDSTRAAFVAEANLMAQLSAHPYIVTIHHAGVAADGRPYLVMEYCAGPSLAEQYKRGSFSVSDALRAGVRLASAVATAHAAGILHRDIKPANVLTNDYGWPALTDFGISSAIDDETEHTTTVARVEAVAATTTESQPVGMSIPWSPAEMFADDPRPDVRSDVFSLAATVHTLLAGRSPFEVVGQRNGAIELIDRIERGSVTPIGRSDVPRSLVAVLAKAMAVHKEDRFASAIEFARALQRVELELGYSQTNLDVPNLGVAPVVPQGRGDDAETRIRSVATIDPHTDADATVVRQVVLPTTPVADDERTVLHAPVFPSQPGAPSAPPPPPTLPASVPLPPAAQPTSMRGVIIGVSASVLAVLIGVVVILAVVFTGDDVIEQSTASPQATAGPSTAPSGTASSAPTEDPGGESAIVDDPVPSPVSPIVGMNGSVLTFSFVNPAPVAGDIYQYALSENPEAVMPLTSPIIVIPDVAEGQRICVDAYVVRAGKRSEPLTMCYPD